MAEKTEIKLELAFPYKITINPTVNGGCIVNVGCARLSYSTPARMLTDLKKYLADPQGYEQAFYECNKIRGENTLAAPEQPSGQTGAQIPEDTAPDQERAEATSEQEQAESSE